MRLYLVCEAKPLEFLRAAVAGGVDVVQLRDRGLDDDGIRRAAEAFRAAADEAGIPFILNDRPDLVDEVGADGVHLGQEDAGGRAGRILGRSTHAPEQALAAVDADYVSVGPVWETPTKPGRPAAGLDYVTWAAENLADRPWFAIGGIDASNVHEVLERGARRIVVVRAIAGSHDPESAARELREALDGVA